MPFWSRGSSEESQPSSKDFTSTDFDSTSTGSTDFSSLSSSLPSSSSSSSSNNSALLEMQQFALAIQQQALIQDTITTLSDKAFQACITSKPGDSLSGKEAACVQSVVYKWLDTNQFLIKRLEKKSMKAQGQFGG